MKIFIIGAGPSNAYADLASPLKWTYAFVMIAGRLEIYTLLILVGRIFVRSRGD